jgi:hypothetical protein
MPYMLWGYPKDVQYETTNDRGLALPRPDLVYAEGYVRRRLSDVEIPLVRGRNFYELSSAAGKGFSGAPVIKKQHGGGDWQVAGVYVGQRTNEVEGVRVGYAVDPATERRKSGLAGMPD